MAQPRTRYGVYPHDAPTNAQYSRASTHLQVIFIDFWMQWSTPGPEHIPEKMSDRMPDGMSEYMPERMPNRLSECLSDRMSHIYIYISDRISVGWQWGSLKKVFFLPALKPLRAQP